MCWEKENYKLVSGAWLLLSEGLQAFVNQELKKDYTDDWFQLAKDNDWFQGLSSQEINFNDLTVLFYLITPSDKKSWSRVFRRSLTRENLQIASDLRAWRNHWAHQNLEQFSSRKTSKGLNQIFQLLVLVGALDEAEQVYQIRQSLILREQQKPQSNIDLHQCAIEFLNEQIEKLTSNALTAGDFLSFNWQDIHVPLGLVERKEKTKQSQENISAEQGSGLYREPQETIKKIEQNYFFEQVLGQGKSGKSQGKRIAIIGEAGSGKTTRLQEIATWIVRERKDFAEIPIWIPLAALGKKTLREYLIQDWLRKAAQEIGAASPEWISALGEHLKSGKVWLLLDGVDEMGIAHSLHSINEQLEDGLEEARVVLTCRLNVWEAKKNALYKFDVYRNLDFEAEQVKQFINNCFKHDQLRGEALEAELDAPGKERIRDLVRNPLRLMLLCNIWSRGKLKLPDTKAGLYKQFVEGIYDWKNEYFPTDRRQRHKLNRVLGELSRRAIDSQNSRFRLEESFIYEVMGDSELLDLAFDVGWLNQVGVAEGDASEKVYAFYHPTFEEYFAALAIEDRDFFLPRQHKNQPYYEDDKYAPYRIFDSRWQEVLLLWMGRENTEELTSQKLDLLDSLLNFEDGCGRFYTCQAHLIIATISNEFKEFEGIKEVLKELVQSAYLNEFGLQGIKREYIGIPFANQVNGNPRERHHYKASVDIQVARDVLQNANPDLLIPILNELAHSYFEKYQQQDGNNNYNSRCTLSNLLECLKLLSCIQLNYNVPPHYLCLLCDLITHLQTKDSFLKREVAETLIYLGHYIKESILEIRDVWLEVGFLDEIHTIFEDVAKSGLKQQVILILKEIVQEFLGQIPFDAKSCYFGVTALIILDSENKFIVHALNQSLLLKNTSSPEDCHDEIFWGFIHKLIRFLAWSNVNNVDLANFVGEFFNQYLHSYKTSSTEFTKILSYLKDNGVSVDIESLNDLVLQQIKDKNCDSIACYRDCLEFIANYPSKRKEVVKILEDDIKKNFSYDVNYDYIVDKNDDIFHDEKFSLHFHTLNTIPLLLRLDPENLYLQEIHENINWFHWYFTPLGIYFLESELTQIEKINGNSSERDFAINRVLSAALDILNLHTSSKLIFGSQNSEDNYFFDYFGVALPFNLARRIIGQVTNLLSISIIDIVIPAAKIFSRLENDERLVCEKLVQCINTCLIYLCGFQACEVEHFSSEDNSLDVIRNILLETPYRKEIVSTVMDDMHLMWSCAMTMSYPDFYQAWNNPSDTISPPVKALSLNPEGSKNQLYIREQLEYCIRDSSNKNTNLTSLVKCFVVTINVSNNQSEDVIAKRLFKRLFRAACSNQDSPNLKGKDLSDIEYEIETLKRKLNVQHLAIVICDTQESPKLVEVCCQLADVLSISWVTENPIPCIAIQTFHPNRSNLLTAVQAWLSEFFQ